MRLFIIYLYVRARERCKDAPKINSAARNLFRRPESAAAYFQQLLRSSCSSCCFSISLGAIHTSSALRIYDWFANFLLLFHLLFLITILIKPYFKKSQYCMEPVSLIADTISLIHKFLRYLFMHV